MKKTEKPAVLTDCGAVSGACSGRGRGPHLSQNLWDVGVMHLGPCSSVPGSARRRTAHPLGRGGGGCVHPQGAGERRTGTATSQKSTRDWREANRRRHLQTAIHAGVMPSPPPSPPPARPGGWGWTGAVVVVALASRVPISQVAAAGLLCGPARLSAGEETAHRSRQCRCARWRDHPVGSPLHKRRGPKARSKTRFST